MQSDRCAGYDTLSKQQFLVVILGVRAAINTVVDIAVHYHVHMRRRVRHFLGHLNHILRVTVPVLLWKNVVNIYVRISRLRPKNRNKIRTCTRISLRDIFLSVRGSWCFQEINGVWRRLRDAEALAPEITDNDTRTRRYQDRPNSKTSQRLSVFSVTLILGQISCNYTGC